MNRIYLEEVHSLALELYEYLQTHPLVLEDENEGYAQFSDFLESRFDKFFPNLFTGHYRNYN